MNNKIFKHLIVVFIIFSNHSFGKEFNDLFTIYEPIQESSQIEKSINSAFNNIRLKSDYLALVTLGFGEIIPQVFLNGEDIAGRNWTNGTKGITPIDNIRFGGAQFGPFDLAPKFLIYCLLAAAMIFLSLRLRDGRLGRAWLAIREDELAASSHS